MKAPLWGSRRRSGRAARRRRARPVGAVVYTQLLNERGCTIVDTTCPWVSKVWNSVEKHKKHDYTSIIHGKYKHEETVATSSFAGKYLVVLNLDHHKYLNYY